jgi:RNA polymerase primary sigma factor
MNTYDLHKSDVTWKALLNASEAKVLSPAAERELLCELNDCRERLLAALPRPMESELSAADQMTDFQKRVRELASAEGGVDPRTTALRALAKRYQETRTRLALANVRLVAHIAKRYEGRGIPYADLIQEGVCALLLAIDRFELVNETRLATYAIWWIRQGIQRAVAASAYPVRLNPRQLHKLARAHMALSEQTRGRAARVDPPESHHSQTQTIERLLSATRPVFSLDSRSRYDGKTRVVDLLVLPEDETEDAEDLHEHLGNLIETLDAREQLVLKLRFGLKGGTHHSLVQVGRVLGVSKERVRQLQDRALRKLRTVHGRSRSHRPVELAASP